MNYSPAFSNDRPGSPHMATPAEKKSRYFAPSSEDRPPNLRQPSEAPSPSQGLTFQAWEQQQQQHHTPHRHQDVPASPTVEESEITQMGHALSPPSGGGANAGGFSPEVAASHYRGQQEQPQRQSVVGAVIAEAAERRSLRARSSQSRDTDVVHRGTPMSENRQAVAEPRLLWSDLDADGPGSSAGEGMLPQEGGGNGLEGRKIVFYAWNLALKFIQFCSLRRITRRR